MQSNTALNIKHNIQQAEVQFKPVIWLYFFIIMHVITWTLVAILLRHNLPVDSIEGALWGSQLEWGYDKNPFLNGWLTALAVYLGGSSGWMIYLFAQLCVFLSFWSIWQLGLRILSPINALIAVLVLEGVAYFNFSGLDFNDNMLELALWPLAILSFYRALTERSLLAWVCTGCFCGLAFMAKYYTALLLISMFSFLLFTKEQRKLINSKGFWLALAMFSLICLPHIIWLFKHDFITVTYIFKRTNNIPSLLNHFIYPIKFTLAQFAVFLPALIILISLYFTQKPTNLHHANPSRNTIADFNQRFLLFLSAGPFILTLMISFITGATLRTGWGTPLPALWSLLFLIFFKPTLNTQQIKIFLIGIFSLLFILLSSYSVLGAHAYSTANFPGKEIANQVTLLWRERYGIPLEYIAGSRWVSGNISFYSKDHPTVFIDWNKRISPWIKMQKMQEKGAVFVWNETNNHEFLADQIKKAYPHLENPQILTFNWHNNKNLTPVKIGIAILPPKAE